jgi:hypothetical protein
MSANVIPNLLAIALFFVALLISIRAFYTYFQVYSQRVFILGLSMGIIALTAAADFFSGNVTSITLNTDWFLYIGQAVSLLFIFLSFLRASEEYLQRLMGIHILVSALLIGLLLLSASLPAFPNTFVRALLSGSRCAICFSIFYYYVSTFTAKPTRFSFLMSGAFLLLAFGYLMVFQQYFVHDATLLDNIGDLIRVIGLGFLLVAVFAG